MANTAHEYLNEETMKALTILHSKTVLPTPDETLMFTLVQSLVAISVGIAELRQTIEGLPERVNISVD